jgi:hypothetical protein
MIRDIKDIPMINVQVSIPQPDWTNEEEKYYMREIAKKNAELMGAKIVTDEDGNDHMIYKDRSWWEIF